MKKELQISKFNCKFLILILSLIAFLVVSMLISLSMGSVDIPIKTICDIIYSNILQKPIAESNQAISDVIWLIRFPRIFLAVAVGAGLSIAGVVMQAIVRNPLADPYILGVSSGASLGATAAVMLGVGTAFGSSYVGVSAFIGAIITSFLVLMLANVRGKATTTKLLLAGMAISSVCSALSNFIMYFVNDKNDTQSIVYWLMGSLTGAKWEHVAVILPVTIIAVIFFSSQSKILNLMLLGDETAITLGINLSTLRKIYIVIISVINKPNHTCCINNKPYDWVCWFNYSSFC